MRLHDADRAHKAANLRQDSAALLRLNARPVGFLWHYVCRHKLGHAIVFASVLIAVVCGVSTQYGMKHLIDIIAAPPAADGRVWWAFALLCALITAANPPIQAIRRDIMPSALMGARRSGQTAIRSLPLAIAPTLFGALPGGKAGIVPNQAPIGTRPAHPPRTQPRGWR